MVAIQTTLFTKVGDSLVCTVWTVKQVVSYDGNWIRGLK